MNRWNDKNNSNNKNGMKWRIHSIRSNKIQYPCRKWNQNVIFEAILVVEMVCCKINSTCNPLTDFVHDLVWADRAHDLIKAAFAIQFVWHHHRCMLLTNWPVSAQQSMTQHPIHVIISTFLHQIDAEPSLLMVLVLECWIP